MDTYFLRTAAMAAVVSILLAALLFPLRHWLEGKYAPQTRLRLWQSIAGLLLAGGVIGGAFALPETTITVPERLVSVPSVELESPLSPTSVPDYPDTAVNPPQTASPVTPAPAGPAAPAIEPTVPATETRRTEPRRTLVPLAAVVGAVWYAIAWLLVLGQVVRYHLARRKLLRASTPTSEFDGLMEELKVQASVRRLPGLDSPIALGLLHPTVFLPEGEADPLAVRHELTHILRRDLWDKWGLFFACALYWFDPLVWYMARVAGQDMEAACDAQVTAGMDDSGKRAYGELLLSASAGGRAAPFSTRFGGGKEQMKARLSQLFRPGKTGKVIVGAVSCLAFLAAGLVACKSAGPVLPDGTYYATVNYEQMLRDDFDFQSAPLDLRDCVPAAGWVGDVYDTVTLPLAEQVILGNGLVREDTENRDAKILSFLARPTLSPEFHSESMDVIQLEVKDGEITSMRWLEGQTFVGGMLWRDENHWVPASYILRLPASMREGAEVRESSMTMDNEGRLTQAEAIFYQKGVKGLEGLLMTIHGMDEADFWMEHPAVAVNDALGNIIPLGTGGGLMFYAEYPDYLYDDMTEEYTALCDELRGSVGPEAFCYLGAESYVGETYTNEAYGFSISIPGSWYRHYTVRDIGGQLAFYSTMGNKLTRLFRIVRDPLSILDEFRTEGDPSGYAGVTTEFAWVLGEGGGMLYRLIMDPEDEWYDFDDHSPEANWYRTMYQDAWNMEPTGFVYLGTQIYTSERYGFSLTLPDSWRGFWKAEESEGNVDFYYQPKNYYYTEGTELLFSLVLRDEPAPEDEPGQAELIGSGNGVYVYAHWGQMIPANLFRHETNAAQYQTMYEDSRQMAEDGWTLTFTKANPSVALPAVAADPAARAAFIDVLQDLVYGLRFPDGEEVPREYRDTVDKSQFAVGDVDGDGLEELVLLYSEGPTAGMGGFVVGYDRDSGETHIELEEFPRLTFYESGAIQAGASHNQGPGELWPYTLYWYNRETDRYEAVATVESWDKERQPVEDSGQPYPDWADTSGSGTVYYIIRDGSWDTRAASPVDVTKYLKWRSQYLGSEEREVVLNYQPATKDNIAALAHGGGSTVPTSAGGGAGGGPGRVQAASFVPSDIHGIVYAELAGRDGNVYPLQDPEALEALSEALGGAKEVPSAGCPFESVLYLRRADGARGMLLPAEDSCAVFRSDGKFYDFSGSALGSDNEGLYALFGTTPEALSRAAGDNQAGIMPLAVVEQAYGPSYFPGFTISEARRNENRRESRGSIPGGEVCYRLTPAGGDFTVWVNGTGTVMQVETASGHWMEAVIPHFFPEVAAYRSELHVLDATGDGKDDLIFMARTGGTDAQSTFCLVFDLDQRTIYELSSFEHFQMAEELLSLVTVEGAAVNQTTEGPEAWCRVSVPGKPPQGAKVILNAGTALGNCDFSVVMEPQWFDLWIEDGVLMAAANVYIPSAFGYLGIVSAPLEFNRGSQRFSIGQASLEISRPAEVPPIPVG